MKNISLKFKLYTLSSFLILLTIIIGGIGYYSQTRIVNEYSYVAHRNLPNIKSVGLMISRYRLARVMVTELAINGISKENAEESIAGFKKAWADFEIEHQKYLKVQFAPGEDELYQAFKKSFEDVKASQEEVVNLFKKGAVPGSDNYKAMIKLIFEDIKMKGDKVKETGNKLLAFHEDRADKRVISADRVTRLSTYTILGTIVIGSLIGGIFAVSFSSALVNNLTKISDALSTAGIQVSSGSNQIAATAQELSQSTTEQSSSLEETAASIEEMSSMIQKSTENAKKTYDFANSSKVSAVSGKEVVIEMIESIAEINRSNQNIMEAIDESNKRMEEIVTVIGEIGNKTKVINDIVFQTKLLSFNASVEAARAGEMGKGFAVVAEEVGNLAAMSGNAAKEISEMLDSSISKVEDIVKVTKTKVERLVEDGKKKVESGTVIAKKCGEVLDTIVFNVDDVNKLASEISVASDEQSKGIQEISKATAMLENVTQQNAIASEESSRASEDLSRQAHELTMLVSELEQTINGKSATESSSKSNVLTMPHKTKKTFSNTQSDKPTQNKELKNFTNTKKTAGDSSAPSAEDDSLSH